MKSTYFMAVPQLCVRCNTGRARKITTFGQRPSIPCRRKMAIAELGIPRRLAFDTGRENPQNPDNFAAFLLEHTDGPFHERVGHGRVSFSQLRSLAQSHEITTHKDILEQSAILTLIRWGENQNTKRGQADKRRGFALWASPPGDGYPEARFMIYEEPQGEWLTYHAIPSDCSLEEMLHGVGMLTNSTLTKDYLRANVFPLTPSPEEHWAEALIRYFRLPPGAVEIIKRGKHIERKAEAKVVAHEILISHLQQFTSARTYADHLYLGATLEREAEMRGFRLQYKGSCGISNLAALQGIFDSLYEGGFQLNITGHNLSQNRGEQGICIVCRKNRSVAGGCGFCESCAKKL